MPVIVDIVITAAILLAVYLGARSGLLQSLAGVIVVVASGLGASLAAKVLADPVAAWLQPMLTQKLTAQIQSRGAASASAGDMLSIFGFSGQALSRLVENVTAQVVETGRSVLETVVGSVVHSISYAGVFLVSFLVLLVVLTLLIKPLELATKLPGLRTLNALGGGLLGLIKGVLLVFCAVWILRKLQLLITPQLMEESMFLPFFVNRSPLSLLTGL
jgi:uncharacterized membrane protein required for colicin V production